MNTNQSLLSMRFGNNTHHLQSTILTYNPNVGSFKLESQFNVARRYYADDFFALRVVCNSPNEINPRIWDFSLFFFYDWLCYVFLSLLLLFFEAIPPSDCRRFVTVLLLFFFFVYFNLLLRQIFVYVWFQCLIMAFASVSIVRIKLNALFFKS